MVKSWEQDLAVQSQQGNHLCSKGHRQVSEEEVDTMGEKSLPTTHISEDQWLQYTETKKLKHKEKILKQAKELNRKKKNQTVSAHKVFSVFLAIVDIQMKSTL